MTIPSRHRRSILAVALVLAALASAGCGERSEPTGERVEPYPVSVQDATGATVELDAKPSQVAVLDREGQSILQALGVPATLAADPNGNPRSAELVRSRPALLVAGPHNHALQLKRLHDRVAVPVYVTGGGSIAAVRRSIVDLGLLTDTAVRARQLVGEIAAAQAQAAPADGSERPTVFVDVGFLQTEGAQTLVGDLIRAAGARDVVGTAIDEGPVTAEQIAKLDPQIWLASSDAGETLAQLRKDPVLRKIAAIRSGRFAVVPAELLQPGPRVAEALARIAQAIHGAR
jgi:ABC-type Fe3+-hydroxamate transport system substrate-binding protein